MSLRNVQLEQPAHQWKGRESLLINLLHYSCNADAPRLWSSPQHFLLKRKAISSHVGSDSILNLLYVVARYQKYNQRDKSYMYCISQEHPSLANLFRWNLSPERSFQGLGISSSFIWCIPADNLHSRYSLFRAPPPEFLLSTIVPLKVSKKKEDSEKSWQMELKVWSYVFRFRWCT